jgi:peptidyl-prolyl cis-trans isomerase SurA
MTLESYRQQVADEIERAMLVSREIGSHVNVTPQDVERYYKAHSDEYAQAEQVHVRHIFLPMSGRSEEEVRTQMEDIRKRATAGEDFGKLADENSQGPGAGQGGDLGNFKKGQMAKEIEDVAFALKPGEISQPFRMGAGMHLIKVEEHTIPGQQEIDKDTAEQIKRKLYSEALKQRYDRWFQEDLRFRHSIENFLTASSNRPSRAQLKKKAEESTEKKTSEEQSPEPETQEKPGFFGNVKGAVEDLWPF